MSICTASHARFHDMRRNFRPLASLLVRAAFGGALLVGCGDAPAGDGEDAIRATDADELAPARRKGDDPIDFPDDDDPPPPPPPTARAHVHVRFPPNETSPCGTQINSNTGYWVSRPLFPNMPEPQKSRHCRFIWYSTSSAAAPVAALSQRYPTAVVRVLSSSATPPGSAGGSSYAPNPRPGCQGPFLAPMTTCPPSHGCESCNGVFLGGTLYGWTTTPSTSFTVIQYLGEEVQITPVTLPYPAQTFTVPNFDAKLGGRGFDVFLGP